MCVLTGWVVLFLFLLTYIKKKQKPATVYTCYTSCHIDRGYQKKPKLLRDFLGILEAENCACVLCLISDAQCFLVPPDLQFFIASVYIQAP